MTAEENVGRVNGMEVSVLKETVSAIQDDPELGSCRFRARNKWIDAGHNCSTISGFFGAKQEMAHEQEFELHADAPPRLAGEEDELFPIGAPLQHFPFLPWHISPFSLTQTTLDPVLTILVQFECWWRKEVFNIGRGHSNS